MQNNLTLLSPSTVAVVTGTRSFEEIQRQFHKTRRRCTRPLPQIHAEILKSFNRKTQEESQDD